MCSYSKKWILLLDLLLIVYPPFYLLALRHLQKKVVERVRAFLKQADYVNDILASFKTSRIYGVLQDVEFFHST